MYDIGIWNSIIYLRLPIFLLYFYFGSASWFYCFLLSLRNEVLLEIVYVLKFSKLHERKIVNFETFNITRQNFLKILRKNHDDI